MVAISAFAGTEATGGQRISWPAGEVFRGSWRTVNSFLHLVLGGIRSGKSHHAEALASASRDAGLFRCHLCHRNDGRRNAG